MNLPDRVHGELDSGMCVEKHDQPYKTDHHHHLEHLSPSQQLHRHPSEPAPATDDEGKAKGVVGLERTAFRLRYI